MNSSNEYMQAVSFLAMLLTTNSYDCFMKKEDRKRISMLWFDLCNYNNQTKINSV
jgi:hypothetical protein